jgi:hypothetical protein
MDRVEANLWSDLAAAAISRIVPKHCKVEHSYRKNGSYANVLVEMLNSVRVHVVIADDRIIDGRKMPEIRVYRYGMDTCRYIDIPQQRDLCDPSWDPAPIVDRIEEFVTEAKEHKDE